MKDYKEYLKSKAKPIRGSATLDPPAGGQEALQSVASMAVMDLISEGPIYGLIDSEGKKPNNINILESVYLEEAPVLARNVSQAQIRTVDFDQIQMIGRLTSGNIKTAFDNISGELVAHEGRNLNNPTMSRFRKEEIGEDKQALFEFLEENKSLSRFGMIQFKLPGIFPSTDNIYSRISTTTNQFESSPPVDPSTVTNFSVEWNDGTNTLSGTATIAIQAGTTATPLREHGSLKWNIAASDGKTYQMFKQEANDGRFFWNLGGNAISLYSYAKSSTNGNNTSLAINGATSTSEDFPWTDRTASTWYKYPGAANLSPSIAWNDEPVKFKSFNNQPNEIYNVTTFDLDIYNGGHKSKRSIQLEDGRVVEIPSPIVYGYQSFNDGTFNYTTSPGMLDVNQAGKIGKQYLIDGFAGGGIYFFEIGDNEEESSAGVFNTGKFFVEKGGSVSVINSIQSGIDNGYDVFVYDSATGPISLESPSPNQLSPIVGEIAGTEIGLGHTNDLSFQYNYGNIDFDFRNGFEIQPTMEGHDQGVQDFDIRKKLYGPLSYAGSASAGDGEGYSDLRQNNTADFSAWMINPPLENDAYPYTHTIKRIDVKKCTPTIAIEALSDVIDDGDDAGVQRSETLLISYRYGFEGGVSGVLSDLLAAGNSIKDIAFGLFEREELVRYEGIVTSNYLDTYSEIGDLPKNKSLKSLVIDSNDIPGLTTALINQYGLTAGAQIFPGEEWKLPNRFLTIEKKSFESDSTLISRECSITYVSESIKEPFSYPLVATAGTIFDARSFATQPSRDFEVRGKLIAIPSNYEPLNEDGSDKRFISSSKNYGLRSIQTSDGSSNYAKVYDHIDLGTNNFEIEARIGFGIVSKTSTDPQYIVETDGGFAQANRLAIFQRENSIRAIIKGSTLTDGAATNEFELVTSIAGRNNEHQYSEWEYINNAQNLTISVPKVIVTDGADGKDIDIQFDYLIGDNVTDGAILWTNSPQRLEIKFNSDGRINMQAAGRSANGTNKDGNDTIITTTVSSVNSNSTRIFRKFEFVQFKIEGNLLDGITLKDVSKDPPETIVELTSSQ